MNISILDKNGFIIIDDTERQFTIPKIFEVIVIDATHIQIVNTFYNVIFNYANIILPTSTSIFDLQSKLQAFSGEGSAAVGNATAAKQDAQTSILGNIKTNTDLIASTNTKLDSVISNTSGIQVDTEDLETLITSSNTKLDTLHTDLGVVEGKQDTGNTSLSTIAGKDFATQTTLAEIALDTDNLVKGTTSTESSVAANAASVTLKALNTNRKSIAIRNDGTGVLYVSKTASATASAPVKLLQDDIVVIDNYTGIISGIWVGVNGNAQVEETV